MLSEGTFMHWCLMALPKCNTGLSHRYLTFKDATNASKVAEYTNKATHVVTFQATVPALGWNTYRLGCRL